MSEHAAFNPGLNSQEDRYKEYLMYTVEQFAAHFEHNVGKDEEMEVVGDDACFAVGVNLACVLIESLGIN